MLPAGRGGGVLRKAEGEQHRGGEESGQAVTSGGAPARPQETSGIQIAPPPKSVPSSQGKAAEFHVPTPVIIGYCDTSPLDRPIL